MSNVMIWRLTWHAFEIAISFILSDVVLLWIMSLLVLHSLVLNRRHCELDENMVNLNFSKTQ